MHGTVHGLFRILGAIAMVAILLGAWLVYRINEAPLSLSPLTAYIENALSQPPLTVTIGDTLLAWSKAHRSLEIQTIDVKIVSEGQTLAVFPEMTVSLAGRPLLQGRIAPRAISLYRPEVHLVRAENGATEIGIGGAGDAPGSHPFADILQGLLAPIDNKTNNFAGSLRRVEIVEARATLEDRQHHRSWTAPKADLTFTRDRSGLALSAGVDLSTTTEATTHFQLEGLYNAPGQSFEGTLGIDSVSSQALATLMPHLAGFAALDAPIGATLHLRYQTDAGLTGIAADIRIGEGRVSLDPATHSVLKLKSVTAHADYGDNQLRLTAFHADLGGPILTAEGTVDDPLGAAALSLRIALDPVELDSLAGLWPAKLAPNPRAWMLANMRKGTIHTLNASLKAHLPDKNSGLEAMALDDLQGTMAVQDGEVRAIAALPLVKQVQATVTFDPDSFVITLQGGQAEGVGITEGRVVLSGLSHSLQRATMSLKLAGSLRDILSYIDQPPLGWPHKLGVDPAQVSGTAQLVLSLDFPLLDNLSLDALKIKVEADVQAMGVPKIYRDLELSDANLHLSIDNQGLSAAGPAQIDHLPAQLVWRENFSKETVLKSGFHSRYEITALLSDPSRARAGLPDALFQPPVLSGVMPVSLLIEVPEAGSYRIDVAADLTRTGLAVPGLNLVKTAGSPAKLSAQLLVMEDQLRRIDALRLQAGSRVDIAAQIDFDKGALRRVTVDHARWARTALSGVATWQPGDGSIRLSVNGSRFDAREWISGKPVDPNTDRAPVKIPAPKPTKAAQRPPPKPPVTAHPEVTPLIITGRFDKIWLSDEDAISGVSLDLVRDHHDWRNITLDGEIGAHRRAHLELDPDGPESSRVAAQIDDAGTLFHALGLSDTVRGGQVVLSGRIDDRDPERPVEGRLTVDDFRMVEAPVLARLMTFAGLTGIVDLMRGEGIHFAHLVMPFNYRDGVIRIEDGRASGNAIGITAKGDVDIDQDWLALDGTIVPAYALNSALGTLPFVGGLFSAEKGGGVVAFNYQTWGPSGDPDFRVNPLSALTPGFLRHFFDLFDGAAAPNKEGAAAPNKEGAAVPPKP